MILKKENESCITTISESNDNTRIHIQKKYKPGYSESVKSINVETTSDYHVRFRIAELKGNRLYERILEIDKEDLGHLLAFLQDRHSRLKERNF